MLLAQECFDCSFCFENADEPLGQILVLSYSVRIMGHITLVGSWSSSTFIPVNFIKTNALP